MALAVIDASVAIKWFLEEEDYQVAQRLREDFLEGLLQLRVPSLLPFEVLNGLRYSRRYRGPELREAATGLDRAALVTIPLVGEFMERTVALALDANVTIYDASYVALADLAKCPLYSADEGLLNLARRRIEAFHIRDYETNI